MSLKSGAETIVEQCLKISSEEEVVVVNDGNDQELIDSLLEVLEENSIEFDYLEYEEPENHGEEPPERIAEAMKEADVFIAPTVKSISHTEARVKACENGSRGATLPGITKEIWNTSLQADYGKVEELSEKVYKLLEKTEEVRVETPSGTDLRFEVDTEYFHTDTGMIRGPGEFGNLPAGEADGGTVKAEGTLVIDHMPYIENSKGLEVEIRDNEVVSVEGEETRLQETFSEVEGSRNIAEFGFGTNPEATLIGNILQDEKVLGTVHIAFGDNTSYIPEGDEKRNPCDIHWDTVCKEPTVWFDDTKLLEEGEPVF